MKDGTRSGTLLISPLKVLRSAAGYYIGRLCIETDEENNCFMFGHEEPYSRESDYFRTFSDAENALTKDGFIVRDCVENNLSYALGIISISDK